jgi:hypothetical protein
MITGNYRGGLGNQLFQVATGYALALDNNDTYCINFNNHKEIGQIGHGIKNYKKNIFKDFIETDTQNINVYDGRSYVNYEPIPYSSNLLIDGYFQSEKYFSKYKQQLIEKFGFIDITKIPNVCTIHIRLTDYLSPCNHMFNICNRQYYINSIEHIRSVNPNTKFRMISDDIPMAKNILNGYDVDGLVSDDVQGLRYLAESQYCILSNSSFSWWGSYLGNVQLSTAPYKWNKDYQVDDVYRSDMIKIYY